MIEIIRNYKDNIRHVYEEPPIGIYNDSYYREACGGYELFNRSNGSELDDIRRYTLNITALKPTDHALDIGCGRGELVLALAQQSVEKVIGIDLSDDAIAIARNACAKLVGNGSMEIEKMSATKLDLADESFDVAFMTDIVEHLSDANLTSAIAEAYRILKPQGRLIIHTLPTVNYKLYGQYLTKYYFKLKGIDWWTPTTREEAAHGHINIQSRASLTAYLERSFRRENINVYYGPVNQGGLLKKLVGLFGLWSIMSPHLWAIARK